MIQIMTNILGYAVLIYFSLIGGLFLAQRDMMYFPSYDKPVLKSTGVIGMEEIRVRTSDGLTLFGWYKSPATAEKPTILWFHGNASNVAWTATRAIPYLKQGYGVLLAEYRGYSSNPGKPSENGIYNDARAFMAWLTQQKETPANSVILYGESLGSGPAIQIAMENPTVHALVLEAPMSSAQEIAQKHYPFMPVRMLLKDKYDNITKIKEIKSPLIVVHGEEDTVIPYVFGKKLFDAAPEPKSMITIQGANHNDLGEFDIAGKVMSILSE
jgi:fermentation-respiration switch protein FrsA (DUF1100 family)